MSGQRQLGIDVLVELRKGRGWAGQCKCYEDISTTGIRKASDVFLKHVRHWRTRRRVGRFILLLASDTSRTELRDQIAREKKRFSRHRIAYEAWDLSHIANLLSQHRDLAHRYLSEPWAEKLCGGPRRQALSEDASAKLAGFALSQIAGAADTAANHELDRARDLANEGQRDGALHEIALLQSKMWPALGPQARARSLRLRAEILLHGAEDLATPKALLAEADALDPAAAPSLVHAKVAAAERGPEAALHLLAGRDGVHERNFRAATQIALGRPADALANLGPAPLGDDESHRLRALAYFALGDLELARHSAELALEARPKSVVTRFTVAALGYAAALASVARPTQITGWPRPVGWEFVRQDDESATAVRRAEGIFAKLASLTGLPSDDRKDLEGWRLACLAIDQQRAREAAEYARTLLLADPLHCQAISWAVARNWRVPAASADRLAERVTLGVATPVECVTLLALLEHSGRHSQALTAVEGCHSFLERTGNADLSRVWRAQALIRAGKIEDAIATQDADSQADPVTGLVLLARAERTGDFTEALTYAIRLQTELHEPGMLLHVCQILAGRARWAELASQIAWLEEVGTAKTVHLAAVTAWNTTNLNQCLGILERGKSVYPGGDLPAYLQRMRVDCLRRLGRVQEAAQQASVLASTEDTTKSLEQLVETLFEKLDTPGAAVQARRLLGRPDLRAASALRIASRVRAVDTGLAHALWKQATAKRLEDALVPAAVTLGLAVGKGSEVRPLLRRVQQIAARGGSRIARRATVQDYVAFVRQRAERIKDLDTRYRIGDIALPMAAEALGMSLVVPYQQELDDREHGGTEGALLARWGGRGDSADYPPAAADIRLYMDVTSLLVAEHFELLDDVESAFRPIRLAQSSTDALRAIRDALEPGQPNRQRAHELIQSLITDARMAVDDKADGKEVAELPSELVAARGPEWAARLGRAVAQGEYVLEYLPLRSATGELAALPEQFEKHLVNCGMLVKSLRSLGALPKDREAAALDALASEAKPLPADLQLLRGAELVVPHLAVAEHLAEIGVLEIASTMFKIRLAARAHSELQGNLRNAERDRRSRIWMDALIGRIRSGVEDGRYELLPQASPLGKRTQEHGPATRGLLELLTAKRGLGEVLWIEDRALSRRALEWQIGLVNSLDVIAALRHYGKIAPERFHSLLLRLRRAGVYFLPLRADELSYHIGNTTFIEGHWAETEELATLRRYFARAIDADALVFPPAGNVEIAGEQGFVLSALHAVETYLVALWASTRPEAEKRAVSGWLWGAFGVHETRGLPPGTSGPQADLMVARLATLVGCALRLEPAERKGYQRWLADSLLNPRLAVDPGLGQQLVATIRSVLLARFLNKEDLKSRDYRYAVARLLGDLIDHLPTPISSALWEDRSVAEALGRQVRGVVSLGPLRLAHPDVWRAAASALQKGEAGIETLEGISGTVTVIGAAKGGRVLSFQAGSERFDLAEPWLSLLSPSVEERTKALRQCRSWFDEDDTGFDRAVAEIAITEDPAPRVEGLWAVEARSSTRHYARLIERLRDGRCQWEDLAPPPIDALLGSLRLATESDGTTAREKMCRGAETLCREEGLRAALERYSVLPVEPPESLLRRLDELEASAKRSVLLTLCRSRLSPVGRCHVLRLLLRPSRDPDLQKAAEDGLSALLSNGHDMARAFLALLGIAEEFLVGRPRFGELPVALQLAATWIHADRLYCALRELGADDAWISQLPEKSAAAPLVAFMRTEETWCDIASYRQLSPEALLVFALGYAVEAAPDGFVSPTIRDALADRYTATVAEDGTRLPLPPILSNRENGRDAMGCLVNWRPSLINVVGRQAAEALSPAALDRWSTTLTDRLCQDAQDLQTWLLLAAVVGHFPSPAGIRDSLITIAARVDLAEPTQDPARSLAAAATLLFLCYQHAIRVLGNDATLPERLIDSVARALHEKSRDFSGDLVEQWSGMLLEACVWSALVQGQPAETARRFSEVFRRVAAACPSIGSHARPVIQHLADRLPIDQGKQLWSLLTFLRTLP